MITLKHWNAQGAVFKDLSGRVHTLALADLLELAEEGRDRQSGQRLPGFAERLGSARITTVEDRSTDGAYGWRFVLDDGRAFGVSSEAVADACEPPLWVVPRVSRAGAEAAPQAIYDHSAVMADDETLRMCLLAVARQGFARIEGAPTDGGEVERLIARFGPVRETNYGRLFDVKVKPAAANLADTALPLPLHADNPYRITPPDLQVLHCLATAGEGGDTVLVDAFAVVDLLVPEDVALLAGVPVEFAWSDGETHLRANGPVIEFDTKGGLIRQRSRGAILDPDVDVRAAWRLAFSRLQSLLSQPNFALSLRLVPGDMLIFDNRRILHGRTGFTATDSGSDAERHLQGAYADADGLYSTLFRLTGARAATEMTSLGDLFDSAAMDDPYGEDISIRDHMLQSAELAMARSLGAEMVAAALLHDIGWALGDGVSGAQHEHLGADRVARLLGPAIAEPIRHHVAAKRYLVTMRPDYNAILSDASRHTLIMQGGPMTDVECAKFAAEPAFDAAMSLRLLDDVGKELRAPSTRFSSYAPMLRRQMMRHMLAR